MECQPPTASARGAWSIADQLAARHGALPLRALRSELGHSEGEGGRHVCRNYLFPPNTFSVKFDL